VECFHAKNAAIIIMTIFTTLTPLDPDRRPSDAPFDPFIQQQPLPSSS
jgi:hypothetical protein